MAITEGALIALAIISGLVSAGTTAGTAIYNTEQQKKANQKNIELQNAANEQNQYNIEHAHQIEMEDLKAAGLNPVLTATGGNGAPLTSIQAPTTSAPKLDLSGVNTALSGIMNIMLLSALSNGVLKSTGQNAAAGGAVYSSKQINSILNSNHYGHAISDAKLLAKLKKMGLTYNQARNIANYNIWK